MAGAILLGVASGLWFLVLMFCFYFIRKVRQPCGLGVCGCVLCGAVPCVDKSNFASVAGDLGGLSLGGARRDG